MPSSTPNQTLFVFLPTFSLSIRPHIQKYRTSYGRISPRNSQYRGGVNSSNAGTPYPVVQYTSSDLSAVTPYSLSRNTFRPIPSPADLPPVSFQSNITTHYHRNRRRRCFRNTEENKLDQPGLLAPFRPPFPPMIDCAAQRVDLAVPPPPPPGTVCFQRNDVSVFPNCLVCVCLVWSFVSCSKGEVRLIKVWVNASVSTFEEIGLF